MAEQKYGTAAARWAGVGPYYAMFPSRFADDVIQRFTRPGDLVLDPFAGRGTAVFSAATHDRNGIGVEINPVGWVYAKSKLTAAPQHLVVSRIRDIEGLAPRYRRIATQMPSFFRWCYSPGVLEFLLAARANLRWHEHNVDRTAMAFLLINLHGKRTDSLSNQMRQTKSMSPDYAIRWWRERRLRPPEVDPVAFLIKRIAWRYAKGVPPRSDSRVHLGDSTRVLPAIKKYMTGPRRRVRLLLTSPPYCGVTNYHYDQWLRLWLLGGQPNSLRVKGRYRDKFENHESYRALLTSVFGHCKSILAHDATIYVRTDKREVTLNSTLEVLQHVFPHHSIQQKRQPYRKATQTQLFGHSVPSVGEVDLILTR